MILTKKYSTVKLKRKNESSAHFELFYSLWVYWV